ncbi:CotH kinase family protein [Streptomyces radicis]|uniref:Spore coat protein CotH n=1 Tax=Streptomyces radicis TaxID=1750517 RepID=A0A3A9WE20_9ACTN|nr:CotH kinase family protein [Streptomyces radicis]RKN10882.1 spore coat protein CotH [Streptomyces radicis]RKN25146.1 spore coat protein CotH [Streptomyces radicis]
MRAPSAPGARRGRRPWHRLRDRVPVRLRQHWRPAAAFAVGLTVLVVVFGDARVAPFVTSASQAETDPITQEIQGTVDLYDASVTHSVELDYTQDDFDRMMAEFRDEGTKDYIRADLVIDGTVVEDVGIRLKGNSTLMSLRSTGSGVGPGGQEGERPEGGGGMTAYGLSEDRPEELPWLIKIDEYVEGRTYQGHREIALRPGSDEEVPLNEALSLALTESSGQAAEPYGFASVTVNDRPTVTRLMVENPSTDYATTTLGGNGVLYRARAEGSFAYVGDDPTDYEDSFEQLNKEGSQDLGPLIRLIRWVDEASDEEFAAELGDHVDIASLAAYVATQNLLLNFDDMAGPGKNYLLWYDLDTRKFSVLGWDYNLAFSGAADTGPDDEVGMGDPGDLGVPGGGGGGGGGRPGDEIPEGALPEGGMPEGAMPGGEPPGDMPEGFPEEMPEGFLGSGPPDGLEEGRVMGHVLKERFLAEDSFTDDYHAAYAELYERFYGSGQAIDALAEITEQVTRASVDASDVDAAAIDAAAEELRATLTERAEALANDEVVTG